ncbi:MAG TPA: glycosyltransferase family 1 protein [Bacteroidia bacterium]|nr:glycosyltransferase family 1 protein [Bacteroidia bacterium]
MQHNKLEGIGRFMFETLKRITVAHPEHHFYFIFDRPFHEDFIFSDNITPIIAGPPARHPFLFVYWLEFTVYDLLKKLNIDLFLSCDGYLSLRSSVRQLAVIHDINFYHYPNDLPWLVRKYYNYYFPKFAKKANRIATVSNFSKQDMVNSYHINPELIDVVFNGCSEGFVPVDVKKRAATEKKIAQGCPYFLFVGSIQPRKNLQRLFKAFDLFKKKSNASHKLIIAGSKYFWNQTMKDSLASCEFIKDIIFLGRVEEEMLHEITASAYAAVYVPLYEGFGIPLLEAMHCEVPIITSNVSSLPEVAGDAALYCDPNDVEDIANAMLKLVNDHSIRTELLEKGKIRKQLFSWDATADLLWESCNKVLKN